MLVQKFESNKTNGNDIGGSNYALLFNKYNTYKYSIQVSEVFFEVEILLLL